MQGTRLNVVSSHNGRSAGFSEYVNVEDSEHMCPARFDTSHSNNGTRI
jgi:hypothetical protein